MSDYVPPTLCFGCRANEGIPIGPADSFGPFGVGWERFICERCGVEDVRPATYNGSPEVGG